MKEIVLIFTTFSLLTPYVTKIITAHETSHTGLKQFPPPEDIRIVGGNEAVPNTFPYQVALTRTNDESYLFCGGSLITRRYVLTAAHCLNDGLVSLVVILGAHNILQNESTQQRIRTSTFKIHELYTNETVENDLGMIYLPIPANLNRYVKLIALPLRADASNSFVGSEAIASGWGSNTGSAADASAVLLYITVPIIANDVCNITYGPYVTDSIICSGGAGNKGICYGDSGGPLVVNGKLVGVTSFLGYNGCEGGEPSGFSRVTSFLDWISANSDAVIS
ncbi:brachyurin-like isoform X2 [Agrilus planipennis]|uniref:Brachyurin-like isoform X1 n=1 Tax=Agrilus planipennis TaxID=224129 RepID=A0A1W4X7N8_AGRPL|nr:brachyurin-like isoform X1 [Agrilus planipennis]XP_025835879.1 brachyurin-like isoform X2 [Agrilus planipennis]